jgi:hypothetical protein
MSENESQVESTETKTDAAPEAEAPVEKKYLPEDALDALVSIKVDGVLQEIPVREAIRLQQLEKASRSRFDESARIKSEAEKKMKEYEELDPDEFLKRRGFDPIEYAEKKLQALLEDMEKSPEQKELEQLRKMKAEKDAEEKKRKETEERAQLTRQEQEEIQKYQEEFEASMVKAFEASNLPRHPFFIAQAAAIMGEAANKGIDLTPEESISLIKKRSSALIPSLLEQLDDESFETMLGKKNLERVRQKLLSKVQTSEKKLATNQKSADEATRKPVTKTFRTVDEYRAWLDTK